MNSSSIKILGTLYSPFVRRILLFTAHHKIVVDTKFFTNILDNKFPEILQNNPAHQVPILIDEKDQKTIYDSRLIAMYLMDKFHINKFTFEEEQFLYLINLVNDSAVQLLLHERHGLSSIEGGKKIKIKLLERIENSLTYIHQNINQFENWNFCSISLYCLLDWITFRKIYDWECEGSESKFSGFHHFMKKNTSQLNVSETNPRNFI